MIDIYKTCKRLHEALYVRTKDISEKIPVVGTDKRLTDLAFVLDKSIDYLEETIRDMKKVRDEVSKQASIFYIQNGLQPLQGAFATGVAKVTKSAEIPSMTKDPAKYQRLCEIMGVPFHPLSRIHYPALKEHLTAIIERGENIPEELAEYKQYEGYNFVVKSRDDSNLDELAAETTGILGEQ